MVALVFSSSLQVRSALRYRVPDMSKDNRAPYPIDAIGKVRHS